MLWLCAASAALFFLLPVTAAPSTAPAPQHIFAFDSTYTHDAPSAWKRPWTRLRDTVIESFFSPFAQSDHISRPAHHPKPVSPQYSARYGDELVIRFNVSTDDELESLAAACSDLFLDVWDFSSSQVDIRIPESLVPNLLGLLPRSLQHAHSSLIHPRDLRTLVSMSYKPDSARPDRTFRTSPTKLSQEQENVFFDEYRPWSVIVPWMSLLESMFPSHVRKISIGKTFEGRDIWALRVGAHPTNSQKPLGPRKTIIVAAGAHAREWISTSTVTYMAYYFVIMYGRSPRYTELVDKFDWVFIPTINPDGYVYTWETDRLWRKNRQKTSLPFCKGIDLDRAWDFMWSGQSVDDNPCSESYAGETAFHATEAQQFAEWVRNETESNTKFVAYLDLHSYSQQILYPYAFSCQNVPPTLENLEEIAQGLAKVMRRHGSYYTVLPACKRSATVAPRFYNQGGSPLDWFYHEVNVKNAYQIKLPDTGSYGFLLPKEYIKPTGKQTLNAALYFGNVLAHGTYDVKPVDINDLFDSNQTVINHFEDL